MRKGRMNIKRLIGLGAIITLVAGNIAGCGKGKNTSVLEQAVSGAKDNVFRTEKLDLGDQAGKDYNRILLVGNRVYATTYADSGKMSVISFNQDGSNPTSYSIPESDNESHGYMCFDSEGNMYSILEEYHYSDDEAVLYSDSDEDPEGMNKAEAVYEEEENKQYLVKYDPQGAEVLRVLLGEDLAEGEYFSVYSMIYDEKYGVLMASTKGIQLFNEADSSFKTLLDTTDKSSPYADSSISLYNGFDGQIFASLWTDKGLELSSFDPATGKMGEKSTAFHTFDNYIFFGGNGYDLYISKSDGIYGYDKSKDNIEKLVDYVYSDINVDYTISSIVAISDQEFIANLPDGDSGYNLFRLTKVPADQVKDKATITLAGSFIDYDIRQRAYKFNQENSDYRIKIVDYSSMVEGDDWAEGTKQFNLDIVSGSTPDIMLFASDEPVDSYINKGLFIDLMPFIGSDPELKDAEFVQNVFDAFKTGDKLFQLVPSYYINTVTTKTSYLNGQKTLSLKDCNDMIKAKGIKPGASFGLTGRESILYYGLMTSGDQYIDWENKKCNFDNESFMELLEFAKQFPAEITDDMYTDFDDACFFKGDALFDFTYVNNFRSYKREKQGRFGSDISYIGFPNELGVNCSVINSNYRFAISSKTKYADVSWQFIRQYLLEDYQNSLEYDFPIRKSSFDKLAEKSMDRPYWTDEDGIKVYDDEYAYIGDQEIRLDPLTKEEVQFMKDFVQSVTLVYAPNQNVYNIVNEEASAFFNDQKTAKEVADIIQSRLTIYVNENS